MAVSVNRKTPYDEGSLDQYLRDISVYPLITREEEVTLAQRIRQNDQEALDKLVRSNLRFVVSVAKKYQNQGVSLSDLINEGNLGLIRAAHKFDETKGIKFISYAVWWIRQASSRRSPSSRASCACRSTAPARCTASASARTRCSRSSDAQPTHAEIAEGMDITEEEVAKTMLDLADPSLARRADDAGRRQPAARLSPRQHQSDARRADVRESAHRGDRGVAVESEGAGIEDPAAVFRISTARSR